MVQEANLVSPTSSVSVEHMFAYWLRFYET